MKTKIAVLDYGVGNLLSIQRAFAAIDETITFVNSAEEISAASHLVIPGVGAFREGMQKLTKLGVIDAIRTYAQSEKPLLGICLGMQLLFEASEEFGLTAGLALISGQVKAIPRLTLDGKKLKSPHVGWSTLRFPENGAICRALPADPAFYFVHSFQGLPSVEAERLAVTEFGGHHLTAMVQKDNVLGCQFHPEKSGLSGLQLLKYFVGL